jgi:hypothetical protein
VEDNGRGLAADQVAASQSKGRHPDCKGYTIMLIGSIGKIHSFKISRRLLIWTLVFLFLYILISIIIIYLYFGLFRENRERISVIKRLESELSEKKRTLDQNQLYTEGLEDYIKNLPKEADGSIKTGQAKEIDTKQEAASVAQDNKDVKGGASPEKKIQTTSADIQDIKFRMDQQGLTVEFKLANNLAAQGQAEGYIHIYAIDKNGEYPPEWNKYPERLKNGIPSDYKTGQEFLIQRFKTYHRQYKMLADFELPSFIRILVYDRSGRNILEKEIPVIDVPAND